MHRLGEENIDAIETFTSGGFGDLPLDTISRNDRRVRSSGTTSPITVKNRQMSRLRHVYGKISGLGGSDRFQGRHVYDLRRCKGHDEVFNLQGGILAWMRSGLPLAEMA